MAWILLTLCLLEGASRIGFYAYWGGRFYPIQSTEYSLRQGWQLRPGTYQGYQINNQGFRRRHDVALAPLDKTMRIFLVGGSTAFGSNGLYPQVHPKPLDHRETIDSQLQALLEARHPDLHFEVINAAVNEYRLYQEISLFLEKLVNFHPHLVIFLDGHNDISFLTQGKALARDPVPYWNNRHLVRGELVLNASILSPVYYLDINLGRASYLYHGLSMFHQRLHETAFLSLTSAAGPWGDGVFRLSDEKLLKHQYAQYLNELDSVLPLYLSSVKDLKAIGNSRGTKLVYALQPEIC
jgi:hypothetical protein